LAGDKGNEWWGARRCRNPGEEKNKSNSGGEEKSVKGTVGGVLQ